MEHLEFTQLVIEKMFKDMNNTPLGERFEDGPLSGASIYNAKNYALKMFEQAAKSVTAKIVSNKVKLGEGEKAG